MPQVGESRTHFLSPVASATGDFLFHFFHLLRVYMNCSMFSRSLLVIATALCLVGCNSSNLTTVTGKVTYNDKPVTTGTVSFVSADKPTAYGNIGPDGTYALMTDKPGDGATPGSYQVSIVALEDMGDRMPEDRDPLPPPVIPDKYSNAATSGLTAEVEAGKDNVIDFDLTGKLGS